MELHFETVEHPAPQILEDLSERLFRFNVATSGRDDFQPFAILLRSGADEVVGGICGGTRWDWAHIDTLWIDAPFRGHGNGAKLLAQAEALAISRGCQMIDLDTFSFQAPDFYRHQGYEEYAVLAGMGGGITKHFFRKPLLTTQDRV
jgi:GNAT superfamily N-acetyltransferase